MRMNYNNWFYEFHRYLSGTKDGNIVYNDTNWVDIGKRYQSLIETSSHLLREQPYGVVGNNIAFDKLLDLLERSNYTFEDINDALVTTYEHTLRGAMSNMLVNTHNVLVHYKNTDREHVYIDKTTGYYVIEVPFAQMHFDERDEFIRQKLHMMHSTDTDLYIPLSKFLTDEIVNILGFTILCTTNGFICNDCYVAMSEKGLRFKIHWSHSEDADFIIYKLDECYVCNAEIPMTVLETDQTDHVIPMQLLPTNLQSHIGQKCILNLYDQNYADSTIVAPNFGELTSEGLAIHNMQSHTMDALHRYNTTTVTISMYFIKYLHEVPNVYPAINYYDIMDCRRVLTDHQRDVVTEDGNRVLMQTTGEVNDLEVCTPPICIDRKTDTSFNALTMCLSMYRVLLDQKQHIESIVRWITNPNASVAVIDDMVMEPADEWYRAVYPYYLAYYKCAIITSVIPNTLVQRLKDMMDVMDGIRNITTVDEINLYREHEDLYDYDTFSREIFAPFEHTRLEYFTNLHELAVNYYQEDTPYRFNRPVSEQSFLTLRYNIDERCWVFTDPKIQHFHGIGNTFYINDGLYGDEVFKFFVLYSDTESPAETNVIDDALPTLSLDFDLFSQEVNRHIGFIRYWNAENKLMKLSHIMLHDTSEEMTVQVLSKILKHKLEGRDILDEYGSDHIYTKATMTSSNVGATDMELQAPFAINFLFYTLASIQGNEDQLEAFFYQQLTNRKFDQRYVDLDVSDALKRHGTFPLNVSRVSLAPNTLDHTDDMKLNGQMTMYYGLPLLCMDRTIIDVANAYRYTYHVYQNQTEYPCVTNENAFDDAHHVSFDDVTSCGYQQYDFTSDAMVARYISFYLTSLRDCISTLETNYTTSFNQTALLESGIHQLEKQIDELRNFAQDKTFYHADTQQLIDSIITDNPFITLFQSMIEAIHGCLYSTKLHGTNKNLYDNVNTYLGILSKTYQQTGFDQIALKRIRKLYVHMKTINQPMTIFEYERWLKDIDDNYISKEISVAVSNNPNRVQNAMDFDAYGNAFVFAKYNHLLPSIATLKALFEDLDALKTTHLLPLETYCAEIMDRYIFDLYVMDAITLGNVSLNRKPAYVIVTVPRDTHTILPSTSGIGTTSLLFVPSISMSGANYTITDLRPIAEYAFFDGVPWTTGIVATAYDELGNAINTVSITKITFIKVSSSSATTSDFHQIPNLYNTRVDIQNVHESFTVVNQNIVNQKYGVMNYELLYGNRFKPLQHTSEYVVQPKQTLQGPIDRLYLSNQWINRMALKEYGARNAQRIFFKPSQVLHLPMDAQRHMDAFGGKNFVGQRIYLSTSDTNYVFPAVVTCIDHSQARGILEAKVVSRDAKWLELQDPVLIERYLTSDITCTVIPDNIGNFLDEFSNGEYGVYFNPSNVTSIDPSDDLYTDMYSLPGDPIFVQNHANFVYTRLNHFFHELVPDRFIDDAHKTWRFIYMGYRDTRYDGDPDSFLIMLQCLNHNFNTLTDPEMYPILREEPNDHGVYAEEYKVFSKALSESIADVAMYNNLINQYRADMINAPTEYDRQQLADQIHTTRVKLNMAYAKAHKLQYWMEQRENPSTWYNVNSYDAAEVYIDNGRAERSTTFIDDIRDIPWFDGLQLFIYNWEDHTWVDPSTYDFDRYSTSNYGIDYFSNTDNPDSFFTTDVLKHLTVFPKDGFPHSKRLLFYFAYETSDFVNPDRHALENTCEVRFKPILSLNRDTMDVDPYAKLYVRKHFDVNETYQYDAYNTPTDFTGNAYHVIRNRRSGKDVYPPAVRLCDVSVTNDGTEQPFALYTKLPFPNATTNRTVNTPIIQVLPYQTMDDFVPNQRIKFICIQNRSNVKYDGNISSIMFEGVTGNDETDTITILSSSLPSYTTGTFICTVFMDPSYRCKGGIYSIQLDVTSQNLINGGWIQIPKTIDQYKELPMEFLIVPNNTLSGTTTISLKATYTKQSDDQMHDANVGFNPFEYYFDTTNEVRLPIADVRTNDHKKRLVIDPSIHTSIDLIKTNYIGICRYAVSNIPSDGFIDVSGYIPTPLSRDRYEFWVNGRYIKHPDDLVILSPTTFQLRNLKSLHNFELIELVDDTEDNDLIKHDTVYMAEDGTVYGTYERALLSRHNILQQDIRYTFNGYPNHTKLQDYVGDILPDANNVDVEVNILTALQDHTPTSYNELRNVPSINGIPLYHVTTDHLGIQEVPFETILHAYDMTWKKEILTDPFFPMTHADSSMFNRSLNQLQIKPDGEMYSIYIKGISTRYQTLYISQSQSGVISDTTNTLKIIPFVKPGTIIHVEQKYHGMWVHSTDEAYAPVLIK